KLRRSAAANQPVDRPNSVPWPTASQGAPLPRQATAVRSTARLPDATTTCGLSRRIRDRSAARRHTPRKEPMGSLLQECTTNVWPALKADTSLGGGESWGGGP